MRIFELLLRLYPPAHRTRFGRDMRHSFARELSEARARGSLALTSLWVRTVADAVVLGLGRRIGISTRAGAASLGRALTHGARTVVRSPSFTAGVVLILALGLGANVTMFQIVDRLLLSAPDHVDAPDEVRRVFVKQVWFTGEVETQAWLSWPDYLTLEELSTVGAVAPFGASREQILGTGAGAEKIRIKQLGAGAFPLLGVEPAYGRFYGEEEDRIGAEPVAVLSHAFWQRRFGQDPTVVGRVLEIGSGRYTVVGVTPPGFTGVEVTPVDAFLPAETSAAIESGDGWVDARNWVWTSAVARLAPGTTPEAFEAEATAAFRAPRDPGGPRMDPPPVVLSASLLPADAPTAPPEVAVSTWVAGVALLVLLVACANVANLFLARGLQRRRERAVRSALGAGRGELVLGVAVQVMTLTTLGGLVALALARWGGPVLRSFLLPGIAFPDGVLSPRMLLFAGSAVLVTTLLAGVAPALRATGLAHGAALRDGTRGATLRRSRVRRALLVLQSALSVVLLVGAGLFVRSLEEALSVELGFDPDQAAYARMDFEGDPDLETRQDLYLRGSERLRALPGVTAASVYAGAPFGGTIGVPTFLSPQDSALRLPGNGPFIYSVENDYFEAMGIRLVRGRGFGPEGRSFDGARVVVVNEALAAAVWPGEDPLGRFLFVYRPDAPCSRVVGIAENHVRAALVEEPSPIYYVPIAQGQHASAWPTGIVARGRSGPEALVPSLRTELRAFSPRIRFVTAGVYRDLLEGELRGWRLGATMFSLFGLLALVVAATGLYSVLAFDVASRRQELGIRTALGARPSRTVGLVLRDTLGVTALGVALGLAGAWALAERMEGLLFQASATPGAYVGAALALLLTGLAASVLPALRVSRVDPARVMRSE